VRITCRRLKGEIELTVDDDGPGVNPDAMEKIFSASTPVSASGFWGRIPVSAVDLASDRRGHGGRLWTENAPRRRTAARPGCSGPAYPALAGDVRGRHHSDRPLPP